MNVNYLCHYCLFKIYIHVCYSEFVLALGEIITQYQLQLGHFACTWLIFTAVKYPEPSTLHTSSNY